MTDASQCNLPHSLSVDLHGDIAVLSLSRREKRNAIDTEIIHGIDHFFSVLPIMGIRAVVIRGDGDHFCAGADPAMISELGGPSSLFGSQEAHRTLDRIEYGRVPSSLCCTVLSSAVDWNSRQRRTSGSRSAAPSMPCRKAFAVSFLAPLARYGYRDYSACRG